MLPENNSQITFQSMENQETLWKALASFYFIWLPLKLIWKSSLQKWNLHIQIVWTVSLTF